MDGKSKDLVFFKGLATGNLTIFQWVYGQHKLELVGYFDFILFCFGGGHKGGRVDLGGMESKFDRGALYKIPK